MAWLDHAFEELMCPFSMDCCSMLPSPAGHAAPSLPEHELTPPKAQTAA